MSLLTTSRVFIPSVPSRPRHRPASRAEREREGVDRRVFAVQRFGAAIVGLALLVFGLLVATSGVPFLTSRGERLLGLSANGLLAALSIVVGAVLIGAALRGPRLASTVMIVLGPLFLVSGLVNLGLMGTSRNVLAFQVGNVVFSFAVGLLLLVLGAYGRISGNLPADSPYARPHALVVEPPDLPSTPDEVAAEAAMRVAEIAVAEHHASDEQRRRVAAMAHLRTRDERRRTWMAFDAAIGPARRGLPAGVPRQRVG